MVEFGMSVSFRRCEWLNATESTRFWHKEITQLYGRSRSLWRGSRACASSLQRSLFRRRAHRPRRPSAAIRLTPESESSAQMMKTRMTPLTRISHHGRGLRPSLAFDPLRVFLSLRAGRRLADHDRGEKCGSTSRPRGRTVGKSPVRSTRTAARMSAGLVRGSQSKPMEDGRAATLPRIGGRSAPAPRRPRPRWHGTFRSRSRRPQACRPPRRR